MKIYSMTATFGKLENETLTLAPGLNVIHAPNEWGKSTWCAFLVAMLYGVETKERSTASALAVKEHYAPWSGSPMAGSISLCWQGRDITIQRSTKKRIPMGEFRAFETHTGLEVAELTGDNCGQKLLGVEKSVFLRSGFLRGSDLPLTDDAALRSRLNALVTTGDDSGTAEKLGAQLKELKNRCRSNKSNGLLPVALQQQADLTGKLQEVRALQQQSGEIQTRLEQTVQEQKALRNHQATLSYEESLSHSRKLDTAKAELQATADRLQQQEQICAQLPDAQTVAADTARLEQLQSQQRQLYQQMSLLPPEPQAPETPPVFQGMTLETALHMAQADARVYEENSKPHTFPWYYLLLPIPGLIACFFTHPAGIALTVAMLLVCAVLLRSHFVNEGRRKDTVTALQDKYAPLLPAQWVAAAISCGEGQKQYAAALADSRNRRELIQSQLTELTCQLTAVTGDRPLEAYIRHLQAIRQQHQSLAAIKNQYLNAQQLVLALSDDRKLPEPPGEPDALTYTREQTRSMLEALSATQQRLQLTMGTCQGRMEALGQEPTLLRELTEVNERIDSLEKFYAALELAQQTLVQASQQLQRRFAPRITQQAQTILARLTDGRYDRLLLTQALDLEAAAQGETVLCSTLWRSEGTADQLYLALRLAVAQELTPEAPLILDDALVRFDDKRLGNALDILKEAAGQKQVILFTCQTRERRYTEKE